MPVLPLECRVEQVLRDAREDEPDRGRRQQEHRREGEAPPVRAEERQQVAEGSGRREPP
jgi:hypothetical protein